MCVNCYDFRVASFSNQSNRSIITCCRTHNRKCCKLAHFFDLAGASTLIYKCALPQRDCLHRISSKLLRTLAKRPFGWDTLHIRTNVPFHSEWIRWIDFHSSAHCGLIELYAKRVTWYWPRRRLFVRTFVKITAVTSSRPTASSFINQNWFMQYVFSERFLDETKWKSLCKCIA